MSVIETPVEMTFSSLNEPSHIMELSASERTVGGGVWIFHWWEGKTRAAQIHSRQKTRTTTNHKKYQQVTG